MNEQPDMLITLTTGKQDRGTRATLAFSWGCTALAMGQKVSMFLTMDGTVWAGIGAAKGVLVAGFDQLEEYLEQFFALGGELFVCAPCTEYYCAVDANNPSGKVVEEAKLAGLATIVSKIGPNTKTVTF